MTVEEAGMTVGEAGMTVGEAGMGVGRQEWGLCKGFHQGGREKRNDAADS